MKYKSNCERRKRPNWISDIRTSEYLDDYERHIRRCPDERFSLKPKYIDSNVEDVFLNFLNCFGDIEIIYSSVYNGSYYCTAKSHGDNGFVIVLTARETGTRSVGYGNSYYIGVEYFYNNKEAMSEFHEELSDYIEEYFVDYRVAGQKNESKITFYFNKKSRGGSVSKNAKSINCPSFEDLKLNYPERSRNKIEWLFDLDNPKEFGKIIIWHGPPGTGKTFLIRALAREWHNKDDIIPEYYLDSEQLFTNSNYMFNSFLKFDSTTIEGSDPIKSFRNLKLGNNYDIAYVEETTKLVILEDCGKFFSTEGRNQVGFNRFLNLTDGIIGQDLNAIFLLTANEDIQDIDPAIRRPGRCIQEVYFPKFTVEEGNEWLERNGCSKRVSSEKTLSQLYQIQSGEKRENSYRESGFGFGR